MTTLDLATARALVGNTNRTEPYLSNMIKALSTHSWLNTADDNLRLEAARIVRNAKRRGRRA